MREPLTKSGRGVREEIMAMEKCGHAGCTCLPSPETRFCCQHCEGVQESGAPDEIGCGCGHLGCDPRSIPAAVQEEEIVVADPKLASA